MSSPAGGTESAPIAAYALYRWFDAQDRLLYLGKTGELGKRVSGHVARSMWMQFVARSTVERRETPEELARDERAAIEAEHPLFNKQYNNTPEARERLRAYLESVGRLDLLTAKLRAAIEADRANRERAERQAELEAEREHSSRPPLKRLNPKWEAYWDECDRRYYRWQQAAEGAWWQPWLESIEHEPDDILSVVCPVRTPERAAEVWEWERGLKETEGWAWPMAWVVSAQTYDEPGESSLFGVQQHYSVHVDNTFSRPWESWTPVQATVQDKLIAALVAAGRCTAQASQDRVDLYELRSECEAQAAGAVLHELSWGHTRVAMECTALLQSGPPLRTQP